PFTITLKSQSGTSSAGSPPSGPRIPATWHDPGHPRLQEKVSTACPAAEDRLLGAGSGAIEEVDERHALLKSKLAHAYAVHQAGLTGRPAEHREVLGEEIDGTTIDLAEPVTTPSAGAETPFISSRWLV